jgi:hypothetical protein
VFKIISKVPLKNENPPDKQAGNVRCGVKCETVDLGNFGPLTTPEQTSKRRLAAFANGPEADLGQRRVGRIDNVNPVRK